jgi:hypothetical protein
MYIYKSILALLVVAFNTASAFSYISRSCNIISSGSGNSNNISLFNKRKMIQAGNLQIAAAAALGDSSSGGSGGSGGIGDDVNIMKLLNSKLDAADPANAGDTPDAADTYYTYNNTVSTKTKAKIEVIVDNIMKNCKKNGKNAPEVAVRNLQKYCSPTNVIKNKSTTALVFCFRKCKYSLLLGDFSNYETIGYTKHTDETTNNRYYYVDIKVFAPYKTMLRNGIQFNDMYYPKLRDYNNTCYVIYKLSFKDYEDGSLYIEGHTLVPPRTQI